jgi:hypothetical protein
MDSRIILRMVKKLNQIERKEKSVKEAELELSIQKDSEQKKKAKRERETAWILRGEIPE